MCELLERLTMPELPEVETVRRGLAPVMEGARFAKVEVRRGDLRWPLAEGLRRAARPARPVDGLGRRAKYLVADLSTGDVLLMHLGMSGSFHIERGRQGRHGPATIYHERGKIARARPCRVSHVERRARVTFNDPRRFGSMKLVPRARARQRAAAARDRAGAARQ